MGVVECAKHELLQPFNVLYEKEGERWRWEGWESGAEGRSADNWRSLPEPGAACRCGNTSDALQGPWASPSRKPVDFWILFWSRSNDEMRFSVE